MNEKEIQELREAIVQEGKKITRSKASSLAFLKEIGIVDKRGNLSEAYLQPAQEDTYGKKFSKIRT